MPEYLSGSQRCRLVTESSFFLKRNLNAARLILFSYAPVWPKS